MVNVGSTKEAKASSGKLTAMVLVINELLERPHTSASLVRKIGIYSASYVNRCLTQLKKVGLIGAVKDPKKHISVYYNIGLSSVINRVNF